jgi:hypothetical protein
MASIEHKAKSITFLGLPKLIKGSIMPSRKICPPGSSENDHLRTKVFPNVIK